MVEYKWVALVNTSIGALMASIDMNIVVIAIPTIGKDLPHTSVVDLLWVLLGYSLVNAALLVNFGRLGDIFGRVRLYKYGFLIFTIGSGLCSLSQNGAELVGFRLVQGVGAALISSNSTAILTDAFSVKERGKALGINQIAMVGGSVAGLTVGGVLTQFLGWQSIFWVNLPIGVVATLWAHFKLRELARPQRGQKIDYLGNATLAGALAAILSSISLYSLGDLDFSYLVLFMAAGAVLLAIFVRTERRVKFPMFDFTMFKNRAFTFGVIGQAFNSPARGALNIVLSLYLQGPTMHLSSGEAGIFVLPSTLALAFWGPVSGVLADRWGARFLATMGICVSTLGYFLLAGVPAQTTFLGLLVPLVVIGSGFGMYATPNRTSIMNAVAPHHRGVASGVSTTVIQIGSTLGQGIAFLVMSFYLPVSAIQAILLTHGTAGATYAGGFLMSVHAVYYFSAGLLLAAIIPSAIRGKRYLYDEEPAPSAGAGPPAAPPPPAPDTKPS